jgi:pimeloyl-ACP methyl ester carboxylesterase
MLSLLRRAVFRVYGTLLPNHAARWLERAMLKPRPAPALGIAEPQVPAITHRLPYGSGWIVVTEWGTGPAVLLIHGWGGRSASFHAFVEPLVAAGYRAVTVDLPAHGASHGRRTTVIECAGAALMVGRAVGPLAGLVTHSFGGPVAALAWQHGLRAERVVMLAPPVSMWNVSLPVGDWLGLPRHVSEGMMNQFASRMGISWDELRTDCHVAELTEPLLVVHDEDDRKIPWSHGAAVARAAPQGTLRTTTGLGHRDVLVDSSVIENVVGFVTTRAERARKIA